MPESALTESCSTQPWLYSNWRLLLPMGILATVVGLLGLASCVIGFFYGVLWIVGGILLATGASALLLAAWLYLQRPRLEYEPGWLLLHLGWSRTIPIPIEIVECFFMGQFPSKVRGPTGKEAETATVVVRLAERATEWHAREMAPHLGQWADGYIIVRGTWCEPINMDLLTRMNKLLAEAHRTQKQSVQAAP